MRFFKTTLFIVLVFFIGIVPVFVFANGVIVTDADTVWIPELITAPSDIMDSTDAPSPSLSEAYVSDADTVWSSNLPIISSDVIDASDAPPQELAEAFVNHADTFWSPDLILATSDITDSTDAPPQNLSEVFISHAETVLNIGLEENGWEVAPLPAQPDFFISDASPVQVVWNPDINGDGRIDLVAGKSTMVRVKVEMKDYETLDKQQIVEVRLNFDGIKYTESKTIE